MKEIYIALKRLLWLSKKIDKKSRNLFFVAFGLLVSISILLALIPKIIGDIIDRLGNNNFHYSSLIILALMYVAVEILNYLKKLSVEKASTDSWNKLVELNVNHLLHIDMNWLKGKELGGLNTRFQNSINGAIKLLKIAFMDLLPSFFLVIFAVSVAFYTDIKIGFVITMVVPIAFLIIGKQISSQKGIRISLNDAIENINSKLIEMLTGIDTIRASGNEKTQLKRIGKYSDNIREKEFKHHKSMMAFDALKGFNKMFWNLGVFAFSLYAYRNGEITIGQISTFLLLFVNVIKPLDEFHRFLDELSEASIHTGNFKKLIEIPHDKIFNDKHKESMINKNCNTIVDSQQFSFSYNDTEILKNVTMKLEAGNFYGLVGESGCGKSTYIKTLLGFDFGVGQLKFRDKEIKNLKRSVLTNNIAYVSQKPFILTGTFRDNIVFGLNENFTDKEIMEAAKKAKIYNKIMNSEKGLDSRINPSGSNISGGEAQRIALARLFLDKSAEFIILDEATSALDNVTENLIYNSLFDLTKKGKTVLSIAHRLDTLKKADKIFVMDKGFIVESGSFIELKNKNGFFTRLLERNLEVENV